MSDNERAALAYWFPILQATGVRVPRTRIVETNLDLIDLVDGNTPEGYERFLDQLKGAARDIGYPCFLRTGWLSGKHDWARTCYVHGPDTLHQNVAALVEWSLMVDFIGLPFHSWAVREYLPLTSSFTAFGGLPINRERRYFIRDGKVVCHHPYWPADAIRNPSTTEWQGLLEVLNEELNFEINYLSRRSEQVSRHFDGYWSLDWAETVDGRWFAIDMAPGERSFHWPDCTAPHTEDTPPPGPRKD